MRNKPFEYFMDHGSVYLPLERVVGLSQENNSLLVDGQGRLSTVTEKPLFTHNIGIQEHFWRKLSDQKHKDVCLRIDLLTPHVFRFRLGAGRGVGAGETPMIAHSIEQQFAFKIHKEQSKYCIDTDAMHIEIHKDPYMLSVSDGDGQVIARLGGPEHSRFCQCDSIPSGLIMGADRDRAVETFTLRHGERILGMGERFSGMNRRGEVVDNYAQDGLGNSSPRCYKPIPFLLSSNGYGLYFNTSCPFRAWIGSQSLSEATFVFEDSQLDYYFFYGPHLCDIIRRYTGLTGRAALPPRWSFGYWISRNSFETGDEALEVARRFRSEGLAADVIHFDPPWMGIPDGADCNFEFDKQRFGDPQTIIRELRSLNLHLSVWQLPYISEDSRIYAEASQSGALVDTFVPSDPPKKLGVIDLSDPRALAWYQSKLERLLEMGVDVIKVDFGESTPLNIPYRGYPGIQMHNVYPLLYNKAAFEITEAVKGKGEAVIWARSAYAGSQRYPVHWSGDPDANWQTLPFVLKGALSLSLSGFSFWSCDLGGYLFEPSAELYVRWLQFSMLCSHVRAHGNTPREPWVFGEHALQMFRKYAELRYRLIPYIYSEAAQAASEGLPLMRPLPLDFEDDPVAYTIEDEYLLGRHLLVAPCLVKGARERAIYFPEGEWVDYWSHEVVCGPRWVTYACPLEVLPLFVRRGALIPTEEGRTHTLAKAGKLVFHFYPLACPSGSRDDASVFFDAGRQHVLRVEYRGVEITVSIPGEIPLEEVVSHGAHGGRIRVRRRS